MSPLVSISGCHWLAGVQRQIELQVQIDADEARHVLGALDVARHPVDGIGHAAQQRPGLTASCMPSAALAASTQVSLLPPPCEEFTTSDPLRSATRVRPPGSTWISLP